MMRVVSCVPSWTETLLWAGVNVVGRTRFCIHPQDEIKNIPIVGGTKDLKLDVLNSLSPDLVIMDQEENTLEMANSCSFPKFTSHVSSLEKLSLDLKRLALILNNYSLLNLSVRAAQIIEKKLTVPRDIKVIEWWRAPSIGLENYNLVYVIWKNPFMCVTQETYIGSVLSTLGFENKLFSGDKIKSSSKYPEFNLSDVPDKSILLFSSEPYPFDKFKSEFLQLKTVHSAALVDGESYSWFGIRSILFLESSI